jgi:hypothetical protein
MSKPATKTQPTTRTYVRPDINWNYVSERRGGFVVHKHAFSTTCAGSRACWRSPWTGGSPCMTQSPAGARTCVRCP